MTRTISRFWIALATASAIASPAPALAAFGDRDCSFGGAGLYQSPATSGFMAAAGEATGSMIVRSRVEKTSHFYRVDAAGTSHSSLGSLETFGLIGDEAPVVLSDGTFIFSNGTGPQFGSTPGVAKFLASGGPDTSFGTNGTATASGFLISHGEPAVYPDGRIVVGGASQGPSSLVTAMARFNANGTPDSTFGSGGVASNPASTFSYNRIALQADGAILGVSGTLHLARHTSSGAMDGGFGTGGIVSLSGLFASVSGLRLQPSGKILVAGMSAPQSGLRIARFNTDGSLDTSVGGGAGYRDFSVRPYQKSLEVLPDGRPVLVGGPMNSTTLPGYLVRLGIDLADDVVVALPDYTPASVYLLPSGRLLAGRQFVAELRRHLGDGDAPTCVQATATMTTSPNPSASGQAVTLTATVSAAAGPVPQGTVRFMNGAALIGQTASLVNGTATNTLSNLPSGASSLSAVFYSSSGWADAFSDPVTHSVVTSITVNDPTANSADGGTTMNFTVSLGIAAAGTVTVDYATSDRSAKAGVDYVATSGTLTFLAGESSKPIPVSIIGQSSPHAPRDFFLTLSNPSGGVISKSVGTGTIVYSGSGSLSLYVDDPTIVEGPPGVTLVGFMVSLSRQVSSDMTVDFATADGTAVAGVDYAARSGTMTFAANQTQRWIMVAVNGNNDVQSNRSFFLNLSNLCCRTSVIVKGQGAATIVDDDPTPAAPTVPQYRLYSNISKEHLYTTDANEYAVLGQNGWVQEGIAYTMFSTAGTYGGQHAIPLYRMYLPAIAQHHWTTDANEVMTLVSAPGHTWRYEGIPGYLLPSAGAGTTPLYRLAYPSPPLHLWTTDLNEKNVLSTQYGWTYEGIVGEVLP